MSKFEDRRKFFLEIIDDMAQQEATFAQLMDKGPEYWEKVAREDKDWQEAVAEAEQGTAREEIALTSSAEWFRQQIEKNSDRELLLHRRFTAKLICEQVAGVGLEIEPMYDSFLGTVERLRIMDVEIARRRLDRYARGEGRGQQPE